MKSLNKTICTIILGLLTLVSAQQLSAGPMLLDRGLPTTNLNNAAGADRSNVAWLFGGYTPADYWLVGDSFANTSSDTWFIDTIRLWTMKSTDTAILWGGVEGSAIGVAAGSGTITSATYADASSYQGYSGAYRDMHQVDFSVNITLGSGQTYNFFLDGTSSDSGYVLPYVHASNAARSGSAQNGANNEMLAANVLIGNIASFETWTSLGNGWDKASDVNVQVFGTVPEGGVTLALLGCVFIGLAALRRRYVH